MALSARNWVSQVRMKYCLLVGVAITFLVPVVFRVRASGQDQDVVQLRTTLVPVSFTVKDRNGNYVSGLRAGDLKVFEDGKERPIAYLDTAPFWTDQGRPVVIAVLLDWNLNWNLNWWGSYLKPAQQAMIQLLENLPRGSKIGVFFFGMELGTLQWFTSDRALLEQAIEISPRQAFGVDLHPAMLEAIKHLNTVTMNPELHAHRKILVVVTNNAVFLIEPHELYKSLYFQQGMNVLTALRSSQVTTYAFISGYSEARYHLAHWNVNFFDGVFDGSGGKVLSIGRHPKDYAEEFSKALRELQNSYILFYEPPEASSDGRYHKIKVKIENHDWRVVGAREGYGSYSQQAELGAAERPSADTLPDSGSAELPDMNLWEESRRSSGNTSVVTHLVEKLLKGYGRSGDNLAPLSARMSVDGYGRLPDGTMKVSYTVLFDYQSLWAVQGGGPGLSDGAAFKFWLGETWNHSNLDLQIEILAPGRSLAAQRVQRTVNAFVDFSRIREQQREGVPFRGELLLPQGVWKVKFTAWEPASGRQIELREELEVRGDTVSHRALTSPSAKESMELLDRRPLAFYGGAKSQEITGGESRGMEGGGLSLAVLVDANDHQDKAVYQVLGPALASALSGLQPSDRVAAVAVNDHARMILPPTNDPALLRPAVEGIQNSPSDVTAIDVYDALRVVDTELMNPLPGKRIVVWFGDLTNNFGKYIHEAVWKEIVRNNWWVTYYADEDISSETYEEAIRSARSTKARFYAIVLPQRRPKLSHFEELTRNRKSLLKKYVERTGGKLYEVSKVEDAGEALKKILAEVRGETGPDRR